MAHEQNLLKASAQRISSILFHLPFNVCGHFYIEGNRYRECIKFSDIDITIVISFLKVSTEPFLRKRGIQPNKCNLIAIRIINEHRHQSI